MDDQRRFNPDWSIREERLPRKNDVVIDTDSVIGVVVRTEGEFGHKRVWVEDRTGEEIHSGSHSKLFRIANRDTTVNFYSEYKINKGWTKGTVFNIKGRDYPLMLSHMEYSMMKQTMLYVFRDLNVPELKYFQTFNEDLIEIAPQWMMDAVSSGFLHDRDSILSNEIKILLEEKEVPDNAWNIAGNELLFPDRDTAEAEILKWKNRLKIRRAASVLSKAPKTKDAVIAIGEDGFLYVTDFLQNIGQPGVFNSRLAAAVALSILGDYTVMSALTYDIDTFDI